MITLFCVVVVFGFLAALCNFNGTALVSALIALALVLMKCAP